jgi:hypothetical protein
MVFASYAEVQKIAISEGNLADLKGKWVGSRTIGPSMVQNTDLEISNDSLPVQGKILFHEVRIRGRGGTTEIIDFKQGKINDQGNLFIKGAEMELSLYKDGDKMKLEGPFSWGGVRGTVSFKKK